MVYIRDIELALSLSNDLLDGVGPSEKRCLVVCIQTFVNDSIALGIAGLRLNTQH